MHQTALVRMGFGPVIVCMAVVSDATTAVGSSTDWFKVSELGLVSNNPAHGASDPGVLINICQSLATYTIPGPTPYGTTDAPIATTACLTTTTWNTAILLTTVPTATPAPGATGIGA
ncbi:hypothetical protein AN958_10721 [Leucoagaricus sp. SymC.cos]|nr:hypothetical protein AN958_10721 [Leucoagaricus sp. SymC.cos]